MKEASHRLPAGWSVVELGTIAKLTRGPFGSTLRKEFFVPAGYKVYEQQNAINNDAKRGRYYITQELFDKLARFQVFPRDFVISCAGTIGRITRLPDDAQPGVINQALLKISLNEDIFEPRLFLYLFRSPEFQDKVLVDTRGSAMKNMASVEHLNSLPVPLPPLNEQKRIADKLDVLLNRVDACRRRLENLQRVLVRFRRCILESAANAALGPAHKVPSISRKLGDCLAEIKTGPFGSSLHKSDYVLDGIPVINPMHINDGLLSPSVGMSVSAGTRDRLSEFCLRESDVVIARRGEMGRCAVVTTEQAGWLCGTGSMILRTTNVVRPAYLQMYLSSPGAIAALEAASVGSTMVNLNQSVLQSLLINLPPVHVQDEQVRFAKTLLAACESLQLKVEQSQQLLSNLEPCTLHRAFQGELVPQDPNDEPAELLIGTLVEARDVTIKQKGKVPKKETALVK